MFAAVSKFVTTEKCIIIQTAGVVSCYHRTSSVMAYLLCCSLSTSITQCIGLLSKHILLKKIFSDVAPYVSICVFCLVEEVVSIKSFHLVVFASSHMASKIFNPGANLVDAFIAF